MGVRAHLLAMVLGATIGPGCRAILGEYALEGSDISCAVDTEDEDCGPGEGCDVPPLGDGVCRQVCSEANPCPDHRRCSNNFCSEPIGTPCHGELYFECGYGAECVQHDESGAKIDAPYCSVSCYGDDPDDCPPDYTCIGNVCTM